MIYTVKDIISEKKLQNRYNDLELSKLILSVIDLTTLNDTDTQKTTNQLAERALKIKALNNNKTVAAVCVFPKFARNVSQLLHKSGVKTACVAGMFPNGQSSLNVRIADVKDAVFNGADEIDMVISRGEVIEGNYEFVAEEVKAHKQACGTAHLKVILETGQLSEEQVQKAAAVAIENGADFIKTSTGKAAEGAAPEKSLIMLKEIKKHYEKTGKKIGFKPAGGIRTLADAIIYAELVDAVLGENWLSPDLFRIGASSLAADVLQHLATLKKLPELATII